MSHKKEDQQRTEDLNNTINQLDPKDIYRTRHPRASRIYIPLKYTLSILQDRLYTEPYINSYSLALLVAQMVKNLPAMQETWVRSLGREDPLERSWQPTPVFLPGELHEQRSLAGSSPRGHTESGMTKRLSTIQGCSCCCC